MQTGANVVVVEPKARGGGRSRRRRSQPGSKGRRSRLRERRHLRATERVRAFCPEKRYIRFLEFICPERPASPTLKSQKFAAVGPRCAPRSPAKASIYPTKSRPCSTSWKPNGSPGRGGRADHRIPSREAPREGARHHVKPHPYCYPGTNVYRNKFDIRDAKELEDLETRPFRLPAADASHEAPITPAGYRSVHRYLFQDVYAWGGSTVGLRPDTAPLPSAEPNSSRPR